MIHWRSLLIAGLALLIGCDVRGAPSNTAPKASPRRAVAFRAYRRPVMTWVPPYAVAASLSRLKDRRDGAGPGDALTHLALQFWVPTPDGAARLVGMEEATPAAIAGLRDWAHAHGVRALLCVYNGAEKWDWPLARAAFADHRDAFIQSLVSEMERYDLDGVDVDLEGPGEFPRDMTAFLAFMTRLSAELRRRGKQLTVDTFSADRWNTPNQSWWPDLFPLVNALTSMGYEDNGQTAPEWRSYAAQRKAAGAHADHLLQGMPTDKESWRGNTALEQLEWIRKDGAMGVALWDAQLPAETWREAKTWRLLRDLSRGKRR